MGDLPLSARKPSTLEGIKRLAKKISRERCILHSHALELAAHQAGFSNYAQARRALSEA